MKKNIPYQNIYSLICGALSIIIGGLFFFILFQKRIGVLWFYVLKANVNANLLSTKWLIVSGIFYFMFILASARYGYKRGLALLGLSDQMVVKRRTLLLGIATLFLAAATLTYVYSSLSRQKNVFDQMTASLSKVTDIRIGYHDQALRVSVKVEGKSPDRYVLGFLIRANSFVEQDLNYIEQDVLIKQDVQFINLQYAFSKLGEQYRKALEDYVPSFQQEFIFDEYLDIIAELRLKQHRYFSPQLFRWLGLGKTRVIATVHLLFKCSETSCEFYQKEAEDQTEGDEETTGALHEKIKENLGD